MKKPLLLFILCVCFVAHTSIQAQEQHFRASVATGVNLSQIEGDAQQGYHKVGVSIGAKGAYCFKPNFDISAELLYNARGSRDNPFAEALPADSRKLILTSSLNYADVLIAANFHFMPNEAYTFYRQSLQVGVSYGRLLSSNVSVSRGIYQDKTLETHVLDNLKKDDIAFVVGYSFFFTPRLGLTAKHGVSLRSIYGGSPQTTSSQDYSRFIPYNLTFQLTYNFISPKLNVKSQVEKARKAKERRKKNPLEDL
jgi:hypothetical protein